ncbi:hypothetical protein GCM10011611_17870 [Aliidongia dinghuensis]|uniref:Uncharacterized protein n=1 Tax=Aliidongia dinghuensis TaxID=1867774 RepID=A0A8J3E2P4_9PROT|nr:hypothetical protein GCM10011611_17870 [Aliidongia dinghuensis]
MDMTMAETTTPMPRSAVKRAGGRARTFARKGPEQVRPFAIIARRLGSAKGATECRRRGPAFRMAAPGIFRRPALLDP